MIPLVIIKNPNSLAWQSDHFHQFSFGHFSKYFPLLSSPHILFKKAKSIHCLKDTHCTSFVYILLHVPSSGLAYTFFNTVSGTEQKHGLWRHNLCSIPGLPFMQSLWTSYLTFLYLGFLLYKTWRITVPILQGAIVSIKEVEYI